MLSLLVMMFAAAYGFGIGMAIALWQMAAEPCCTDNGEPHPVQEEEFKKSA